MNSDIVQRSSGPTPPRPPGSTILRLRLIGHMEAWSLTSESVLPSGRKTRALLAVIALAAPRPALRGRLAELLWSRRPEEQARASLRQEIHRLLEVLAPAGEDILIVTRDHLQLRPGAVWVDVEEVMRATVQEPASLSLLDGDLLEDLDGIDPTWDAWLAAERERVRDRGRQLAEALLREQAEPETAIPVAQQLLNIDRAHEGAWRALMRAHAARGERGMAIQAYERCRAVLADLLDTSPSNETQKLWTEIRGPTPRTPVRRPPSVTSGDATEAEVPMMPVGRLATTHIEHDDDDVPVLRPVREPRPKRGGARIGVLQLQMVGTNGDDAHLAPGLAGEITTALSRFRWLFVVLLGTLERLPPDQRDERAIRQNFDVDFLVDGSIQRVGVRLRVTVRLIDLRNGNQVVWARRFDRQEHDLLNLQDEIAAEVVAQIDPEILLIEANRVATQPLVDATAYDLVLRAMPLIWRMQRDSYMQAGAYLAKALILEPDYATAHAWQAVWYNFFVGQGWADDAAASIRRGGEHAERAVALDPQDARGLTIAGHIRAFLYRRPNEALALHDRALKLNPNLAMAWGFSAFNHIYLGLIDEAEERANRYKRLSPLDPNAFLFDLAFVQIHLLKRDYESAAVTGRDLAELNPGFSNLLKPYLSALGHLGYTQEAAAVRQRLRVIEPFFSIERYLATTPFIREQDRDIMAVGLDLAGVPRYIQAEDV